jgi:hypothetical protein
MSEKLRECPCGAEVNSFHVVRCASKYRVTCDCGWRGPARFSPTASIAAWNSRPTDPLVGELVKTLKVMVAYFGPAGCRCGASDCPVKLAYATLEKARTK